MSGLYAIATPPLPSITAVFTTTWPASGALLPPAISIEPVGI